MDQTPEQKKAGKRMRRRHERGEKQYREMMLNFTSHFDFWTICSFSECKRARHCLSKRYSKRQTVPGYEAGNHTAHCIRMLSDSIMPACAALIWYDGLQDIVVDALYGESEPDST